MDGLIFWGIFFALSFLALRWARNSSRRNDTLTRRRQSRLEEKGVYGTPGAGLGEKFGSAGQVGASGEWLTAQTLNILVEDYPGLEVFHGVRLRGKDWDIDHVVSYRGVLLLLDTKRWQAAGHFRMEPTLEPYDGAVLVRRNGKLFFGSRVRLPSMARYVANLFPKMEVFPIVVVQSPHSSVSGGLEDDSLGFVTGADLSSYVRRILDGHQGGNRRRMNSWRRGKGFRWSVADDI